jgi:hypothetical protein
MSGRWLVALSPAPTQLTCHCCVPLVPQDSELDSDSDEKKKAAMKKEVPAAFLPPDGEEMDDEVERVLAHRCQQMHLMPFHERRGQGAVCVFGGGGGARDYKRPGRWREHWAIAGWKGPAGKGWWMRWCRSLAVLR